MILRLEMPYVDRTIESGEVLQWHKQPGDRVTYGEDICTITVRELVRLRRTLMASRITRGSGKGEPEYYLKGAKGFRVYVKLTSSDAGYLREIHADEGMVIQTGDLLATLTTEQGEVIADRQPSSTFRVIGNLTEHPQEEPM